MNYHGTIQKFIIFIGAMTVGGTTLLTIFYALFGTIPSLYEQTTHNLTFLGIILNFTVTATLVILYRAQYFELQNQRRLNEAERGPKIIILSRRIADSRFGNPVFRFELENRGKSSARNLSLIVETKFPENIEYSGMKKEYELKRTESQNAIQSQWATSLAPEEHTSFECDWHVQYQAVDVDEEGNPFFGKCLNSVPHLISLSHDNRMPYFVIKYAIKWTDESESSSDAFGNDFEIVWENHFGRESSHSGQRSYEEIFAFNTREKLDTRDIAS